MKHPTNKQERLEINEKKKREKQNRKRETSEDVGDNTSVASDF
jgi:hypothetical protein